MLTDFLKILHKTPQGHRHTAPVSHEKSSHELTVNAIQERRQGTETTDHLQGCSSCLRGRKIKMRRKSDSQSLITRADLKVSCFLDGGAAVHRTASKGDSVFTIAYSVSWEDHTCSKTV